MTLWHGCKVAFPYALTTAAFLVVSTYSAVFMTSNKINDLRTWLALALTATFIVCCIGTLSLIIGYGAGTMKFDPDFLKYLGGVTIAEVAGIVAIVYNFFFKSPSGAAAVTPK